jgi:hypothetical protein
MAEPETRSVNRCTYTPVYNSPDVGDDRPGFRAKQPYAVLAALRYVLDDPQLGAVVLEHMGGSPSEYAGVLRQAWDGDTGGAIATLTKLDVSGAIAFGHQALDAYEQLLSQADSDLTTAVGRLASAEPDRGVEDVDDRAVQNALDEHSPVSGRLLGLAPVKVAAGSLASRVSVRPIALPVTAPPRPGRSAATVPAGEADPDAVPGAGPLRLGNLDRADLIELPAVSRARLALIGQQIAAGRKRDVLRSIDLLGTAEPLGFLHLERMQFTPVGYVRGELVYSLPLVPGETVRLSHREWSRTETEFATLVATSVETARDDALAEKSELTESATTQQQHTSAFNSSVTASGGFGPVNVSSSVGYNAANSDSRSRTQSSKHAQEITKSASTRSKEEHKVTFRVTTTSEQEDVSFREITNATASSARWDYHRLMRKWRIDLYRYDIRLTYDVILPEPGSYLLRTYLEIADLDRRLRTGFELHGSDEVHFHGSPDEITGRNWEALAAFYDVALDPPPPLYRKAQANTTQTFDTQLVGEDYLTITLPEGYHFMWIQPDDPRPALRDGGGGLLGHIDPFTSRNQQILRAGARTNSFDWRYLYDWADGNAPPKGSSLALGLNALGTVDQRTVAAWQQAQYAKILDAAKVRFEAYQQRVAMRRAELVARLDRDDALALRKIEREEIMKGVLRWVLGHHFEFYPAGLPDLDTGYVSDLDYYSDETGRVKGRFLDGGRSADLLARYTQQIRFLQTAIEWENINYILYPYFWTDTERWDAKQSLYHPDFEHRTFLRAGAARVVLTLRPQFEKAFLTFMETGRLDHLLDANHPYITVADELKAYATTNDRYTTPANEEKPENLVDTWFEYTPTGALDVTAGHTLDSDEPT